MNDIVLSGISKSYDGKSVLRDVNITFKGGETTFLMGASGSGKTTLIRIISGLEKPDSGSVSGVPERISAVFQENRLFPDFTAVGNIKGACGERITEEEIREHLAAVGLTDDIRKPVKDFSGGMKRRVAIVRAICYGGEIYIMDEPFVGLDEEKKIEVMSYVKDRTKGKTVIIITHDIKEAEFFGGNIINMETL